METAKQSTTVLIVEYHDVMLKSLKDLLRSAVPGCRSLEARSAAEAAALAATEDFDMVLMDIDLPDRGGLQAVRRVKKAFPRACLIALSDFDTEHSRAEAASAGAGALVSKRKLPEALALLARTHLGPRE